MAPFFLTAACKTRPVRLFGELTSAEESGNGNPVQTLLRQHPNTDIAHVVAALPQSWRENWVLMPRSMSAQHGPRILLGSPDAASIVSFNLRNDERGYGFLEMMFFNPSTETFSFDEAGFQKDYDESARERADTPEFHGGSYYEADIFATQTDESSVPCSHCHPAAGMRYDVSELAAMFSTAPPEVFQALFDGSNARSRTLLVPESLRQVASGGDAPALAAAVRERAIAFRNRLLPLHIRMIARRVEDRVRDRPAVAIGLLAILKGCDAAEYFSRADWQSALVFFLDETKGRGASRFGALTAASWNESEDRPPITAGLAAIQTDIERVRRATGRSSLSDAVDVRRLAALMLYWDPWADRLSNGDDRSNASVYAWSMTASHKGFWFDGAFVDFQREISSRLVRVAGPDATCEALSQRFLLVR